MESPLKDALLKGQWGIVFGRIIGKIKYWLYIHRTNIENEGSAPHYAFDGMIRFLPSLKKYGIPGRARLFEVIQKVKEINNQRRGKAPNHTFSCASYDAIALEKNPDLELSYIVATPRMKYYMEYSQKIYGIYLKWFSKEDICVYSIDEVFIDVTRYLSTYKMTPRELATAVIQNVLDETGITATCGIGTNLYLCKIAMDIVAKHMEPDKNGVRIAGLDEMAYRKFLWSHQPLTDFWRVGRGISSKLQKYGMYTMGDVARMSVNNEEFLYKLFGINAELLIDHAWGYEPSNIESIKQFKPVTNSLSEGQVLSEAYNYEKARLIIKEMAENLSLSLVRKKLITSKIVLHIIYDVSNLFSSNKNKYYGEVDYDPYGRKVPKHAHGTINLDHKTSSTKLILEGTVNLFDSIINKDLLVRKLCITACDVVNEDDYKNILTFEQMNIFIDYSQLEKQRKKEREEKSLQKAVIDIKDKFGKNSVLKGMNFVDGATMRERNRQFGGHRS